MLRVLELFSPWRSGTFFTSWKYVLFPVDHSHNSVSPRVELVTWGSFWILVEGNLGSFGALLLSVTSLLLNTTASFFLPGKPSACNFLCLNTRAPDVCSPSCFHKSPLFLFPYGLSGLTLGELVHQKGENKLYCFSFDTKKPRASAHWQCGDGNNWVSVRAS